MKFEDVLIKECESFDTSKFSVSLMPPKVFLCGGEANIHSTIQKSLRGRLIEYFHQTGHGLCDSFIMAENFKDYFKEDAYSDLLEFENDIANIATLIIICLESPGSLVEFGIFCNNPSLIHRLLIIVPQREVEGKDSFIFLGPLVNLEKKDKKSVIYYPWPDNSTSEYEHIELIAKDVEKRLERIAKSEIFDFKNTAHISFLIYEIIIFSTPIKLYEIELALAAMSIDIEKKVVTRLIYLLEKINLIDHIVYSSTKYYFDCADEKKRIKFGLTKKGSVKDILALKMALRQSYVLENDEQSKKRKYAMKQINSKRGVKNETN